ncbi:FkbM family methyltransferase [Desulfovibrio gilichinskyi]|uniref:Methyltransferase FkbM domain-containing protein n=1 Tax=Desulfovibrio gilichinskyi TaxID=1519643 RepID=A0A1X7CCU1_9BACT|nr:FkbM family methyltransferase [Desulfovibrio gilichinskyi]SME94037.1 hypothetical protein SAMN06295933_0668 [Desulfovibrio gilichinskyi]
MDYSSIQFTHPNNIPLNAKICIYGTGKGGEESYKMLKQVRPDISIIAFGDSFKTGIIYGLPILSPKELSLQQDKLTLILVCSLYFLDIKNVLQENGVNNISFFAWSKFFDYIFLPEELKSAQSEITRICEMLDTDDDKKLFMDLCDARSLDSKLTNTVISTDGVPELKFKKEHNLTALYPEHTSCSYFDFVDLAQVEYAAQGGVCDGREAVFMVKQCKKLVNLFGFEPQGMEALSKENWNFLDQSPKFKLIAKGLWSNSVKKEFVKNGSASYVSPTGNLENVCEISLCSLSEEAGKLSLKKLDFLFCDIENAEVPMLNGALELIKSSRTQLAICFYHSKKQFLEIPLLLMEELENYVFKVGHYSPTSDESVFYAIPREKYSGHQIYS